MNSQPLIDIDKVKNVVDTLVKGEVVDAIMDTMNRGFGEVNIKVTIQNGVIKIIYVTPTQITRFE